jgi:Secretion system C-terminal sorting domain
LNRIDHAEKFVTTFDKNLITRVNTLKYDTITKSYYDSQKTTNFYNSDSLLVKTIGSGFKNGSWIDTYTGVYEYDASKNNTKITETSWSFITNSWFDTFVRTFDFDSRKNKIKQKIRVWNNTQNIWIDNEEDEFTFDSSNNMMSQVCKRYDSVSKIFDFYFKKTISYNSKNSILEQNNYNWNPIFGWINAIKHNYQYNSDNSVMIKETYSNWDNNIFNFLDRIEYICSQSTTANQEIATTSIVNIYPNPTNTSEINVKSTEKANYTLMDLSGKVLDFGKLSEGNNTLQLNSIQNGMYILKMNQQSFKIVVNK